jgi:hypothetical protein
VWKISCRLERGTTRQQQGDRATTDRGLSRGAKRTADTKRGDLRFAANFSWAEMSTTAVVKSTSND